MADTTGADTTVADTLPGQGGGGDPLLSGGLRPTTYLGPESSCPPEYAGVPVREVLARIEAERRQRAKAGQGESLGAGFLPRPAAATPQPGTGFESGGMLDTCAPSGSLAGLADAVTRDGRLAGLADVELVGVLRA